MDAKRKRVIDLFLRKLRKVDIIKMLEPENIGERFIYRTIKRYQKTGRSKKKPAVLELFGPKPPSRK
jgi:transposase